MYLNTLNLFCISSELLYVSANHVTMFRDDIRDYVHMFGRNIHELILHKH
jgi:hypothetical protein